jgi:NADH-quinone oxidoreductase subunit A
MTSAIEFVPVLIMLGFAVGLAGVINLLTHILGRNKPNPVKLDVYECGIPLLTTGRVRFAIHFYLVAILFLIFDLETVVILPWAVVFNALMESHGVALPLVSLLVFLLILIVGFIYEVKKGAMKWE